MRHFREVLIGCGNRLRIPLYLRPARLCSSFGTWFAARLPSWFGWTLPCGAFETIADGRDAIWSATRPASHARAAGLLRHVAAAAKWAARQVPYAVPGAAGPSAPAVAAMSRCRFPATGALAAAFPQPAADGSGSPRASPARRGLYLLQRRRRSVRRSAPGARCCRGGRE